MPTSSIFVGKVANITEKRKTSSKTQNSLAMTEKLRNAMSNLSAFPKNIYLIEIIFPQTFMWWAGMKGKYFLLHNRVFYWIEWFVIDH